MGEPEAGEAEVADLEVAVDVDWDAVTTHAQTRMSISGGMDVIPVLQTGEQGDKNDAGNLPRRQLGLRLP